MRMRRAAQAVLAGLSIGHLLIQHHHAAGVDLAYVGPGAGFAFLGSFLSLLAGFFLSIGSLLAWPFRMVWRILRRTEGFRNAKVKKLCFWVSTASTRSTLSNSKNSPRECCAARLERWSMK